MGSLERNTGKTELNRIIFFSQLKKITKSEPPQKITKPKGKKGTSPSTSTTKSPKSEAAKARDDARRKMLEEKKRLMKLKQQQQQQNSDNDSTFVQF